MCGNGKCIYYGCRFCLRYMKDPVVIVTRDECDCINDIYAECCNDVCADAYVAEVDDCACAIKPPFTRVSGPSQP